MMKQEYCIRVWGGAWNKDVIPSIQNDLGIREGTYYFNTKKQVNQFKRKLKPYMNLGIIIKERFGTMTHKRTVAVCVLTYEGKEYIIEEDFGYDYPEESAYYIFEDGNYACDCNRASFIRDKYGSGVIEEMECGEKILLKDIWVEYRD